MAMCSFVWVWWDFRKKLAKCNRQETGSGHKAVPLNRVANVMMGRAGKMWSSQDLSAEAREEVYRRRQEQIIAKTQELREEHDALQRERALLIQRMEEESATSGHPPLVFSSAALNDSDLELWGKLYKDSGIRSAINEARLLVGRPPQTQEPPPLADGQQPYSRPGPELPPWFQIVARDRDFFQNSALGFPSEGGHVDYYKVVYLVQGSSPAAAFLPVASCRAGEFHSVHMPHRQGAYSPHQHLCL